MDNTQISEEDKKAIIRRSKKIQIYQAVFDTLDGQWVLKDLIKNFRLFDFRPVPGDRISTDYINGQKSVVWYVLTTIQSKLDAQLKLLEKINHETNYE